MSERKPIRIEIEYDDGYLERALGDDAAKICKAINGGLTMNYIHGMPYKGPQMKEVTRVKPISKGLRAAYKKHHPRA